MKIDDILLFNVSNYYRYSLLSTRGLTKIIVFLCKVCERFFPYRIKKSVYKKIKKCLINIFKKTEYDFIVPVVSDFNNGYGVMDFCLEHKKKYILYQTDPIGTNYAQSKYKNRLKKFEKKLYHYATFVITTPILAKEKCQDTSYDSSKIYPLEFPNVSFKKKKITNSDAILVTFCGNLIKGIRDCSYGLFILSKINIPNIFIIFVGEGQEDVINNYSSTTLKNKIVLCGKKTKAECDEFIYQSTFLLNFDNIISNQVPSKIFDYICTGKPIINFHKNEHSPSLSYLKQYGLSINLQEESDESVISKQIKELEMFIMNNHYNTVPQEIIERVFYKNTPVYVGNKISNLLEKYNN